MLWWPYRPWPKLRWCFKYINFSTSIFWSSSTVIQANYCHQSMPLYHIFERQVCISFSCKTVAAGEQYPRCPQCAPYLVNGHRHHPDYSLGAPLCKTNGHMKGLAKWATSTRSPHDEGAWWLHGRNYFWCSHCPILMSRKGKGFVWLWLLTSAKHIMAAIAFH